MYDDSEIEPEPKGIGGWLIVFIVLQVIVVLVSVLRIEAAFANLDLFDSELAKEYPLYSFLLTFEIFVYLLQTVAPVIGLIILFRLSESTIKFCKVYFSIIMALGFIYIICLFQLSGSFKEDLGHWRYIEVSKELTKIGVINIVGILGAFLWLSYWQVSARVRNTFPKRFSQTDEPLSWDQGIESEVSFVACPHCGSEQPVAATHCLGCNKDLHQDQRFDVPDSPVKQCPHCNAQILASSRFCLTCGKVLDD
jgi:DNA-directed RNA polymerase subunit RPC12/RpoP